MSLSDEDREQIEKAISTLRRPYSTQMWALRNTMKPDAGTDADEVDASSVDETEDADAEPRVGRCSTARPAPGSAPG